MKSPYPLRKIETGFTLIELIVVMIIIGIMAFVVLPRFDLLKGFDEVGYRDKVRATLEYARKSAVAQRRNVRVALASNNLTLTIANDIPEGAGGASFARALSLPVPDRVCGGATNQICAPANVTLTGPASLDFSPLGRPSAAGAYAVVTSESTQNITVEAETGYVH
ncbi:MAG: prepilin-type N-terminal cleavage/methylation domain-containing protein [Sulfuritalea sp.]|nr:prepilin-type N-terminal cleavage/methylation domain-containing protein [Sulfuritalea sp.]